MTTPQYIWKLQENIVDKKCINDLTRFIKTTERYTQFTEVKAFEKEWSTWQGCKYSIFVNSGSSANLVILDALKDLYKWKPGDEIIVPAVTWITDISSVLQLGLKPVFVDCNLNDFAFDYDDLAKKITSKTRMIFLSHLLGFPADIKKIKSVIGNKKILLVEDCCESHGAKIGQKKVGNFGIASSFSFYWGHHMTTVEGGMVCTNDEDVYKQSVLKRSHGLARELPPKYHDFYKSKYPDIDFNFLFLTTGFNVRNTELSAVLGISQIKYLDSYIATRNDNHDIFTSILKRYEEYFIVPYKKGISSFVLPFLLREASHKPLLQKFLTERGIESRPIISGNLLRQPFLKGFRDSNTYPNADFIHKNCFYIGNNQFVGKKRLALLEDLLDDFFTTKIGYKNSKKTAIVDQTEEPC